MKQFGVFFCLSWGSNKNLCVWQRHLCTVLLSPREFTFQKSNRKILFRYVNLEKKILPSYLSHNSHKKLCIDFILHAETMANCYWLLTQPVFVSSPFVEKWDFQQMKCYGKLEERHGTLRQGSNALLCWHRLSKFVSKSWAPRTKGSQLMYTCKQVTEAIK
jgi:hypothetical protein